MIAGIDGSIIYNNQIGAIAYKQALQSGYSIELENIVYSNKGLYWPHNFTVCVKGANMSKFIKRAIEYGYIAKDLFRWARIVIEYNNNIKELIEAVNTDILRHKDSDLLKKYINKIIAESIMK